MIGRVRVLTLALFCSIPQVRAQGAVPTISDNIADREQAGAELVKRVLTMGPRENSQFNGVLKIRAEDKRITEIPVTSQILAGGQTWQSTYIAKTAGGPEETLTIVHAPDKANEYLYSKGKDGGQRLSGDQANIPFAGSDFWLTDLGLEFLHWPKQKLVKVEMRHNRWCTVIESINVKGKTGYAQVLAWLDKESGGPIMAEGYDRSGRRIKEFSIKSLAKVEGEWQLKEMEIRSTKAGTRTRLEFDLKGR